MTKSLCLNCEGCAEYGSTLHGCKKRVVPAEQDVSPLDDLVGLRASKQKSRMRPGATTEDYRHAPAGVGQMAAEYADKPHRLIYGLCGEVEWQKKAIFLMLNLDYGGRKKLIDELYP